MFQEFVVQMVYQVSSVGVQVKRTYNLIQSCLKPLHTCPISSCLNLNGSYVSYGY